MKTLASYRFTSVLLFGLWGFSCVYAQTQMPTANAVNATEQNRKVIVSGVLPDEATHAAIIQKLHDLYGEDRVADRTVVEKLNAPKDWRKQVLKALDSQLNQVSGGKLSISHNTVTLSGKVESDNVKSSINNTMQAAMNPDFKFVDLTSQNDTGQRAIDAVLQKQVIEFEIGSAKPTVQGAQVLDEIVQVLKKVPNLKRVSIDGHTDNDGARIYNLNLSQTRANAVKFYLVSKGLPEHLFSVTGYGPDRPIADNTAPDGRARNRRIEIKIQ